MNGGLINRAVRLVLAVLALLLGLIAPAQAGPPTMVPLTGVQLAAPEMQPAPVIRVYLVAYRAHGPPVSVLVVVPRGLPHPAAVILYGYCDGDPINRADPSGLDWEYVADGGGVVERTLWWDKITPGGWRYMPGTPARVPKPRDDITPAMLGLKGNVFTEANYRAGHGDIYDNWMSSFEMAPIGGGPVAYGPEGARQTLMVPAIGREQAALALRRAAQAMDEVVDEATAIPRGLGQGAANTVNGAKNLVLGIPDLPRQVWNAGQWWQWKTITLGQGGRGAWIDGDWSIPQTDGMRNWNANLLVDDSLYDRQLSENIGGAGLLGVLPVPKVFGARPPPVQTSVPMGYRSLEEYQRAVLSAVLQDEGTMLRATMTRAEHGPVLTGVLDQATGSIKLAINQTEVPANLNAILLARLRQMTTRLHPSVPGTHSEIFALSNALNARSGATIQDMILGNVWLRRAQGMAPLSPAPRCGNCQFLTDGVQMLGQ